MKARLIVTMVFTYIIMACRVCAQQPGAGAYISFKKAPGYFSLSAAGKAAPVYVAATAYPGVLIAAQSLQKDIKSVTGAFPVLLRDKIITPYIIWIGTIGKDTLIDRLIAAKQIDVSGIKDKWEAHITQVVNNPLPGIKKALMIVGSDKRGTIYGIYDLSAQIGVSPWYWWADVPVKTHKKVYVLPKKQVDGGPSVKYRGIFINDEAPAFSGWAKEKFGGINHLVYTKMFELILRLKGNYLWPAMWDNAFNDDDKLDPVLADEYGIVMGTSHHEPMDRAQQEWKRYGSGEWNYETNGAELRGFWRKGIENMGNKETIVTIGMRGDGDKPMTQGSNIALLEKIVKEQRGIIADVTHMDTAATPQMWALYKEVQDYYDKGMRVPDDVTLLLCDDNWGNIRKLPKLDSPARKGGYGIYYHFDYVGDPRNYKWLNTNPISKTWEQMHLAYEYGDKHVWVVNVGDLKPMEYPISFFLDYAWSPEKWPSNKLNDYTREWAAQQFGEKYARQIAGILTLYTKYNGRRKPELLDQPTYSLISYNEFETVVNDYNRLCEKAKQLYQLIPAADKAAYYQLVLHPVEACANLNELYYYAAENKLYAMQGRSTTNTTAAKVKQDFEKDSAISNYYNKIMANGKWDHMMDQTHIGYTYWQEPRVNKMPAVITLQLPAAPQMGLAVEGSELWWPQEKADAVLPGFYPNCGGHYIEVFNRGKGTFRFIAKCDLPGISVEPKNGTVNTQQRIWVNVNWAKVPKGIITVPITFTADNNSKVIVNAFINNIAPLNGCFNENNGYISIEAVHYTKAVNTNHINWQSIPDYGRTLAGIMPAPVTAVRQVPGNNSPHLEYSINLTDTGRADVKAYLSPTLDFTNSTGLHYAISIDNETPQIININADESAKAWGRDVSDNIKILTTKLHISTTGKHVLKYWMVDPGVVLQKIVIDMGGGQPSYLGPPESYRPSEKAN
jgi:hypothetical protein